MAAKPGSSSKATHRKRPGTTSGGGAAARRKTTTAGDAGATMTPAKRTGRAAAGKPKAKRT